ncbi:hypothetical protein ANN_24061 [Periplaneta americana]|uniref:Uncharacterized protein n=1 Tax=Periplaneta americana TaxID=6978 RepID=A0ABQ8S2D0_PERAM|nr:hypothetical protein ANN_24061 [Periplaneta americana]
MLLKVCLHMAVLPRNAINLVDKFRATECTERKKSVRWPTKVTEDAVEDAKERVQRGCNKSVKKLAVDIGVSYGSAHKILRNKLEDARERMQRGRNKSVKKLAVDIGVSYGSAHKILRNKLAKIVKINLATLHTVECVRWSAAEGEEKVSLKLILFEIIIISETDFLDANCDAGGAGIFEFQQRTKICKSRFQGRWCDIVVINAHAPTEEKDDHIRDSFYEELEQTFDQLILPVGLYSCETWTLTLREEHRLRVFGNKVLRKIFGAKRDEVTGEWRKLHNAELHVLYSSPDIIRNIKSRRLRWAGHVARMGESRNAYRVFVGRPEGKRPLGRPRGRWEDNIKMDLREVGYDDRDWINLAQDRDRWRAYVRAAMNLRVP